MCEGNYVSLVLRQMEAIVHVYYLTFKYFHNMRSLENWATSLVLVGTYSVM